MDQFSDEQLLAQITEQNTDALSEIYDRHGQTVYSLIMRIVKTPTLADELLQETFWQIWQDADKFRGEGSAAAWMYRIARNKSLDLLRRQKARPQPVETSSEETDRAMWSQLPAQKAEVEPIAKRRRDRQAVQEALEQIPPEQRECLELAYFEGMTQRQIADHTDTPLGTVKTRIKLGMSKLEYILRGSGYHPDDFD